MASAQQFTLIIKRFISHRISRSFNFTSEEEEYGSKPGRGMLWLFGLWIKGSGCHRSSRERDERHWPGICTQSRRVVRRESKKGVVIPGKKMVLVQDVHFRGILYFRILPKLNAFLKALKLWVLVLFYVSHVSIQQLLSMPLNFCTCLLICETGR